MKVLKSNLGNDILVDDDVYEFARRVTWAETPAPNTTRKYLLIKARGPRGGSKSIYLHRYVMKAQKGQKVMFNDGNPLNCQRNNLRVLDLKPGPKARAKMKRARERTMGRKHTEKPMPADYMEWGPFLAKLRDLFRGKDWFTTSDVWRLACDGRLPMGVVPTTLKRHLAASSHYNNTVARAIGVGFSYRRDRTFTVGMKQYRILRGAHSSSSRQRLWAIHELGTPEPKTVLLPTLPPPESVERAPEEKRQTVMAKRPKTKSRRTSRRKPGTIPNDLAERLLVALEKQEELLSALAAPTEEYPMLPYREVRGPRPTSRLKRVVDALLK